jgi:hypothetical protein
MTRLGSTRRANHRTTVIVRGYARARRAAAVELRQPARSRASRHHLPRPAAALDRSRYTAVTTRAASLYESGRRAARRAVVAWRLMTRFALLAGLALAIPLHAEAQGARKCSTLADPAKVLYLQVGDTQVNLLKRLGRALRDNTANDLTLVWFTSGSCVNISSFYSGAALPRTTTFQYAPSRAEDATWDADNPMHSATLPCVPDDAVVPDIGNSALFNSACTDAGAPPGVHLEEGAVQAYVLAVPKASTQTAITFEEAYFVFGFGKAGMIAPWLDDSQIFTRKPTTSTLLAWARNLGIPADKWPLAPQQLSSQAVVDKINAGNAATIGLLGAEVYDGQRATMNVLAYRARNQRAAYYPDSSATARDKQNVRDGHYTVWSPTIWMDRVDAAGAPVKPATRYVIDLIANKPVAPAPSFEMISLIAKVGLVPDCAMAVTRDFEGGPLRLYTPAESCTCKYESLVAETSCKTCTESCQTGVCRDGYCEAR